MHVSFKKQAGNPALGIAFFWRLAIADTASTTIVDHIIPELFYDYLFVRRGLVSCADSTRGDELPLPAQSLKTLHTRRLDLTFSVPLILFGARLALPFAECYWEPEMPANSFVRTDWVAHEVDDLAAFAGQVTTQINDKRMRKTAAPLLTAALIKTEWLAHYSPRHQRRLTRSVYGLGLKDMHAIQNVHLFLGQTCDFSENSPRITRYVNDEVFYDQPHLNRAFKRMTGFSPLEYFQASSILQDNLMAASYNEELDHFDKIDL